MYKNRDSNMANAFIQCKVWVAMIKYYRKLCEKLKKAKICQKTGLLWMRLPSAALATRAFSGRWCRHRESQFLHKKRSLIVQNRKENTQSDAPTKHIQKMYLADHRVDLWKKTVEYMSETHCVEILSFSRAQMTLLCRKQRFTPEIVEPRTDINASMKMDTNNKNKCFLDNI